MKLMEVWIRSKAGPVDPAVSWRNSNCEDAFVITNDFAAVVDGATSVTGKRWTSDQLTGGQWAAKVLFHGIHGLPPPPPTTTTTTTATTTCSSNSARQIVDSLTECIHAAYQSEGPQVLEIMENKPEERATASMILYCKHSNKIISVGDCQAALLDLSGNIFHRIQPGKYNDQVMSQARCMMLELELARGRTITDLLQDRTDIGRDFIEPLRKGQRLFQNNPKAHPLYQYWVLDGFPVFDQGIQVFDVPRRTRQIVLATDGYPALYPTLSETESELKSVLEKDPLLIHINRSTKGLQSGAESFDDRTYLRIQVAPAMTPLPLLTSLLMDIWSLLLLLLRNLILPQSK